MNKYLKILFGAACVVSLASCLKDKEFEDNVYGHTNTEGNKIIELGETVDGSHETTVGVDFIDADTSVNYLTVRLAAAEVAQEDIVVTLDTSVTAAKILKYNDDNETSVIRLHDTLFSLPATGLKVTIPKGSREAHLKINFNAFKFNPSATYAIGFRIVSVDKPGYTISQNFREYLTLIGAKNDYDGVYLITGTMVDAGGAYFGDYGGAGPDARVYQLITVGADAGLFFDQSWNYPNYIVLNATGGGVNSGVRPQITFDPTTRLVTAMKNVNNNAAIPFGPTSRFNESDHSIDLDWTSLGRFHAVEHWEYIGPR